MSWSLIMMLLEGVVEAEDASGKAADHRDGRSIAMVGVKSAMVELYPRAVRVPKHNTANGRLDQIAQNPFNLDSDGRLCEK